MTDPDPTLSQRLDALKATLDEQGERVRAVVDNAVEALFSGTKDDAQAIIDADADIDRADVAIERTCVALLQSAAASHNAPLTEADIRMVLTIVKVNNELERIADLMVNAVQHAAAFRAMREGPGIPPAFRVLANSVIGIVQLTVRALRDMNATDAGIVLKSDDTTEAFKRQLLRDVETRLAQGQGTVDDVFALHAGAASFARAADHCTNIAEQIIYVVTGLIVRHEDDRWTEPAPPEETAP
ncbi:MAG: phosphate signaling complex protein PhoU [Phycisphaerales bacterium]